MEAAGSGSSWRGGYDPPADTFSLPNTVSYVLPPVGTSYVKKLKTLFFGDALRRSGLLCEALSSSSSRYPASTISNALYSAPLLTHTTKFGIRAERRGDSPVGPRGVSASGEDVAAQHGRIRHGAERISSRIPDEMRRSRADEGESYNPRCCGPQSDQCGAETIATTREGIM